MTKTVLRLVVAAAVAAVLSTHVHQARATLLGLWRLDETAVPSSGTSAADSSGAGLNGTYQPLGGVGGPILGQPGAGVETGTSAQFNGSTDEIFLASPGSLKMANDFTIAAWIKPDDLVGVERIFSQYPVSSPTNIGYGFGINGSGFRFTTYGVKDYNTAADMVPAGRWSHVAVTLDASNDAAFYVNGVLRQTVPGDNPANTGNNNFFIGSTGVGERFGGAIDELQVHSGVLSQAEIQQLAGPFLVGHWALDETANPSGNTAAVDSSGNGFNGVYQPTSGGSGGPEVGIAGALPATGTAADFNGVADEIYLAHPADLANLRNDLTVMAWIKPDDVSDAGLTQRIYSSDSFDATGWGFGIKGDELKFTTYGVKDYLTGAAAGTSGIEADIPTDQYTHVAAVMDVNNGVTFYVNGIQAGSTIGGAAPAKPIGTRNWFIGRTGRSEPYAGALDDVRVYRGALDMGQIQQIAGVPEPSGLALGLGAVLLSAACRTRRRR